MCKVACNLLRVTLLQFLLIYTYFIVFSSLKLRGGGGGVGGGRGGGVMKKLLRNRGVI